MSIKISTFLTAIIILASIGSGCTGNKVQFADAPIDKLDLSRGHKVTGRASGLQLFGFIPIGVNERQIRAYERLKEDAGEDLVTNIKIQDVWKWVFIGMKYNTMMTATAYPVKNSSSNSTAQSMGQRLDELKALHEKGKLTDTEYNTAIKKAIEH
jgi:hypothetical protein